MPTPISVTCPACAASFRVPQPMAGKQVLCPQCKQPLIAPRIWATPQPARESAAAPGRALAVLLLMLLTGLFGVGVGVAVVLLAMNGHWHDDPPAGKHGDPPQVAQQPQDRSKDEPKPPKEKSPPQEKKQPDPNNANKDSLKKDAGKAKTQKQPNKIATEPKEVSRLYLEALGKPERLAQVKGVRMEWKYFTNGSPDSFPCVWTWYAPDRLRVEASLAGGKSALTVVLNGQNGWIRLDDVPKQALPAQTLKALRDAWGWIGVGQFSTLANAQLQPTALEQATVKGRPTTSFRMKAEGPGEITLYFDRDTHLLAKAAYRAPPPSLNGGNAGSPTVADIEFYFSDYRATDGILQWRKLEWSANGKPGGYVEVTTVRFLTEVDESILTGP